MVPGLDGADICALLALPRHVQWGLNQVSRVASCYNPALLVIFVVLVLVLRDLP